MNPEIKKKWVEALRSGKYKQGIGRLKGNDEFCCLGVLCDISGLSNWDAENRYLGDNSLLPMQVVEWAGLDSYNPRCPAPNSSGTLPLSAFNDHRYSFIEIADLIERNL
jgi:hypothetical protein